MAYKVGKIARLQSLTEASQSLREAKLARLQARNAQLRGQLSALGEALRDRAGQSGSDPARQAGADLAWQRWIDIRKISINQNIAQTEQEIELERDALRRDFGRNQVAQALLKNARADSAKRRARNHTA